MREMTLYVCNDGASYSSREFALQHEAALAAENERRKAKDAEEEKKKKLEELCKMETAYFKAIGVIQNAKYHLKSLSCRLETLRKAAFRELTASRPRGQRLRYMKMALDDYFKVAHEHEKYMGILKDARASAKQNFCYNESRIIESEGNNVSAVSKEE